MYRYIVQHILTTSAHAQVFNGTDLGKDRAAEIETGSVITSLSEFIKTFIGGILLYVGLAAVTIIVIAGFFLILSGGNENLKNQAKLMIQYTIIGLFVIGFASVIVRFFTSFL